MDVAVTGSQKALSLPTGLAVMAASPKVIAAETAALIYCLGSCEEQMQACGLILC